MKAVADSNIYVSGLLFKGPPSEFLRLAQLGKMQLFISAPILDEIVGVLSRQKFGLTNSEIARLKRIIQRTARNIEPKAGVDAVKAGTPGSAFTHVNPWLVTELQKIVFLLFSIT